MSADKPTVDAFTAAVLALSADIESALDRFYETLGAGTAGPEPIAIGGKVADLETVSAAVTHLTRRIGAAGQVSAGLIQQLKPVRARMGLTPSCPCHGCVDKAAAAPATPPPASKPSRPTHGPDGQPLN